MPNPLQLLLSQLLGPGGQASPQAPSQAQPPASPQPQAQATQPNAQSSQPKGPPKPGPLEIMFPGGLPAFITSLRDMIQGGKQGAPRSFADGGIAGLRGPETIQVGERGPEVIAPLNQGAPSNPNLMLQNILRMVLGGQRSPTPTGQPPGLVNPNGGPNLALPPPQPIVQPTIRPQGGIAELIRYFRNRLVSPTKMGSPTQVGMNRPTGLSNLI